MLFYIVLVPYWHSLEKVFINSKNKFRQQEGREASVSGWFCRINLSIYIIINYQLYWSIHNDVWIHSAKGPSEMENDHLLELMSFSFVLKQNKSTEIWWLPFQYFMAMGQQTWVNQQGWVTSQISCPVPCSEAQNKTGTSLSPETHLYPLLFFILLPKFVQRPTCMGTKCLCI